MQLLRSVSAQDIFDKEKERLEMEVLAQLRQGIDVETEAKSKEEISEE